MAPKISMYSSLLVLLLLLSTIATENAAFPTPQYLKIIHNKGLKSYEEAKVAGLARRHDVNNNIPSSWLMVFNVLPKGQPVPPSGPSNRHNGGHHHRKGLNEEARVGDQVRRHAIDSIPRRMFGVLRKGDQVPPSGS